MPTKDYRPAEIVTTLREAGILISQSQTVASVIKSLGVPEHIRPDAGPEFTAKVIRGWLELLESQTLFIEPGGPQGMATTSRSAASPETSCSTERYSIR